MAIRVGVIRGEKTGKEIFANLPEKYSGFDIVLTKNNEWIFNRQFSTPERIFRHLDDVFNALHGSFGEDGKLQQLLEKFQIPYTGSGVTASALGMNKLLSRDLFRKAGLFVPETIVVDIFRQEPEEIRERVSILIPPPWVVKPVNSGSRFNVFLARNFDELDRALDIQNGPKAIVEEYLEGEEINCEVVEDFRGQKYCVLPKVPAKIQRMAEAAHQILGCRHYSRQDFIVSNRLGEKGKIYLLELNTVPKTPEFLDHLLTLALNQK